MNRFKKEEKRKHDEALSGLTQEQTDALDRQDAETQAIEELARKIHAEKFPEEYDFMYDSNVDANDRENGINPMSQQYIDEINEKRAGLKVSPLSENGYATSDDSMLLCIEEAKKIRQQSKL